MHEFLVGHATHPDWRGALALAAAQVDARAAAHERGNAGPLTLGFVYFSDHYAAQAADLLAALRARWPGVAWVGSVGVGVCAGGVEYIDEPALVLMLAAVPRGRFEVFSGAAMPRRIEPYSALVHADGQTPDLAELIAEMSDRTESGYLFGGLAASRSERWQVADGLWQGGLSGVAFSRDVALISRVTQGSQPLGPTRRITAADGHVVLELDGQPALPLLLQDIGLRDLDDPRQALPRLRATMVGLTDAVETDDGARAVGPAVVAAEVASPTTTGLKTGLATGVAPARHRAFGADVRVRHLVGLDPGRRAFAVAERVQVGMLLAFCQRDVAAARRDLVRICSEIRDELAPAEGEAPDAGRRILGALYVSCAGRGGPHFGGDSAELKIVQHALGGGRNASSPAADGGGGGTSGTGGTGGTSGTGPASDATEAAPEVPLVGFFAGGEIGHRHVYGYTGVLTVFTGRA